MIIKDHTRIDLAEGGTRFKQGDYARLAFTPRNAAGQVVDLSNKTIEVAIWGNGKGVIYQADAFYDSESKVIRATIDETLESGRFQIEFTVTDASDPTYRKKFPSDEYNAIITITPSTDDIGYVGANIITVARLRDEQAQLQQAFESDIVPRVDELKQRVEDGVGAFTEDTEVLDARMGEQNLRAFNQKVTTQLADIAINLKSFEHLKVAVASGFDWTPSFQAAFDFAQNKKLNLIVPAGTYNLLNETVIRYPINVELKKGAVLKNVNTSANGSSRGVINVESANVEIKGGTIDGNHMDTRGIFGINAHDLKISEISFINTGMAGLYINYSDRVILKDAYTNNCLNGPSGDNRAGSVRFNYCNDLSIDNVIIENTNGKGIAFQSCQNFRMTKTFVNKTLFQSVGIYFNNSHNGYVALCNVTEADGNALKFSRGSSAISVIQSSFSVTLRTVDDGNPGYVVLVQGASHCSVDSCYLYSRNSSIGVRVEDHPDPEGADSNFITISNNLIDMRGNSWRTGLNLPVAVEMRVRTDNTGYKVHDIYVLNNQIISGLQAVRSSDVYNVRIENNECESQKSTTIQVGAANVISGVKINGNKIKDAEGIGISLNRIEGFEVNNNEVKALPLAPSATNGININTQSRNGVISLNRVHHFSGNLISATTSDSEYINIVSNIGVGSSSTQRGVDYRGNNATITGNQFSSVVTPIYISPTSLNITRDREVVRQAEFTTSGDGTKTQFVVPHGLGVKPSFWQVIPTNSTTADAAIRHLTADATNIYVYFKSAPASGSDNVKFLWRGAL